MAGGHRPGVTYKSQVVAKGEESVTFAGDELSGTVTVPVDDVSYFKHDEHYIISISPAPKCDSSSVDSTEPQPGS